MRTAFVVMAGLMLAQPASAASYATSPEDMFAAPSPCAVAQTGFAHLREEMATRETNPLKSAALKATTSSAQLILAMGLLHQPDTPLSRFLVTGHPAETVTAFSFAFLQGVSAMDDQAGVALVLALAEAKGVCARG